MSDEKRPPRPIHDQVLVRQDRPSERVGRAGLIYAPQGEEHWPPFATVVAVGPGATDRFGERVPPGVAAGDRVLFKRRADTSLSPDSREGSTPGWEDLLMLRESDILGVVEPE